MLRKLLIAICSVAVLNMSAGMTTGALAAGPRGVSHGSSHAGGAHVGGRGFRGGHVRGYGGGQYGGPGYGYDPYGYDDGYDEGAAIAAGIIGTAMGLIVASRHHHCWWHNHHRVCR